MLLQEFKQTVRTLYKIRTILALFTEVTNFEIENSLRNIFCKNFQCAIYNLFCFALKVYVQ
jgi:hypothetical protein